MCVLQCFSTEAFLEAPPPPSPAFHLHSSLCAVSLQTVLISYFFIAIRKYLTESKFKKEVSIVTQSWGVQSMKVGKAWQRGLLALISMTQVQTQMAEDTQQAFSFPLYLNLHSSEWDVFTTPRWAFLP